MKLVIAIVNNDDASTVLAEVTRAGFSATKLSTSGGFLKAGNVTFLIGVEEKSVGEVLEIIKDFSSKRTQMAPSTAAYLGESIITSAPIEITVGGATVFVLDVDQFYKL
ncbi:MAG: transcriptional regulator [Clostridiales bacterium]|jgi:uncharacterized protein YaaQ|nr:transcriptional regulator [Clostridiales bacterium]